MKAIDTAKKTCIDLGHEQIDLDHEKLFALIDQIAAAMVIGLGEDTCAGIIDELVGYTKTHFAMEERLMARCHYADAAAHKAQHDDFVGKVAKLRTRVADRLAVLSIETLAVMREWLVEHIQKSDRALVAELAGGIAPAPQTIDGCNR